MQRMKDHISRRQSNDASSELETRNTEASLFNDYPPVNSQVIDDDIEPHVDPEEDASPEMRMEEASKAP